MLKKAPSRRKPEFVVVESEFQKKARCAGGIAREAAILRAEAELLAMRPIMDGLIDDSLVALRHALAEIRSSWPSPNWQLIHDSATRIRDIGTTAGFELLTLVAANLCDVLDEYITRGAGRVDILECHVAALEAFRQESYRGVSPDDAPQLAAGLSALLKLSKRDTR